MQGLIPLFVEEGDTVLTEISILTPDASEANMTGAEVLDSVTVALLFDDFLDFEIGADEIKIEISPDADDKPMIADVLHEPDYVVWVERVTDSLSLLDSIEAEEAAALRLLSDAEAVMPLRRSQLLGPRSFWCHLLAGHRHLFPNSKVLQPDPPLTGHGCCPAEDLFCGYLLRSPMRQSSRSPCWV